MPSFNIHRVFNYVFLLGLPGIFITQIRAWMLIYLVGVVIGSEWITPDLDIVSSPTNKHGKLWKLYWKPYTVFWKHRGNSHTLWGIVERLIYMSPIFILFILFIGWSMNFIIPIGIFIAGIVVANIAHILLDNIL